MSYESPSFEKDDEADALALDLLKRFDGMPVVLIRLVLRQAEFWLNATTTLDCSANEFQKASEEYQRINTKKEHEELKCWAGQMSSRTLAGHRMLHPENHQEDGC